MAMLHPSRFSKPEILWRIDRPHLLAFLAPYTAYFSARGVELPPVEYANGLDYRALSDILLTPDGSTPKDLAEALFYVNELSTPEGFDSLQDAIAGTAIDVAIGEHAASADLALQVCMAEPAIIEKIHAEQCFLRVRSFAYFKTQSLPLPAFALPSAATLVTLAAELDAWFAQKRRGK